MGRKIKFDTFFKMKLFNPIFFIHTNKFCSICIHMIQVQLYVN